MSVGIELVNQTYCRKTEQTTPPEQAEQASARICFYPDFADSQLEILTGLLGDILSRHTEVKPTDIIGHSDIAPQRKIDPGPRFPWQRLYRLGYGAWYDDDTVFKYWSNSDWNCHLSSRCKPHFTLTVMTLNSAASMTSSPETWYGRSRCTSCRGRLAASSMMRPSPFFTRCWRNIDRKNLSSCHQQIAPQRILENRYQERTNYIFS